MHSSLLGFRLSYPHKDRESLMDIWRFMTKLIFLLQSTLVSSSHSLLTRKNWEILQWCSKSVLPSLYRAYKSLGILLEGRLYDSVGLRFCISALILTLLLSEPHIKWSSSKWQQSTIILWPKQKKNFNALRS